MTPKVIHRAQVGKGRIIASVVFENILRRRPKMRPLPLHRIPLPPRRRPAVALSCMRCPKQYRGLVSNSCTALLLATA